MSTIIDNLDNAVIELNKGNVVAIPTETVYGLAARADSPDAIKKVLNLKKGL